jgi:hypothetical protein
MWKIRFWFNMDEATTSIEVDGKADVRIGDMTNTIYVNGVMIDLLGEVDSIRNPEGKVVYNIRGNH